MKVINESNQFGENNIYFNIYLKLKISILIFYCVCVCVCLYIILYFSIHKNNKIKFYMKF